MLINELKNSPNPQDRRVLKERYRSEWKNLHNELVKKYRQVRSDKKSAKKLAKQNHHSKQE